MLNPDLSMCSSCAAKYAAENARECAGFVEGTQLAKIRAMKSNTANTSGYRGIYYEPKFDRWRAQIIFQRKRYYLGTYKKLKDAVKARQRAEEDLYGSFLSKIEQADSVGKVDKNEGKI